MGTTFEELKRLILLNIPEDIDGLMDLAIEEGIDRAQRAMTRVQNFDELTVLDTANAVTVANQKTYHLITDWNLSRPKDILSIRYMADFESRKLIWVPISKFDKIIPYPENFSTSKPKFYITRGDNTDLFPIPANAANLYITHTQWPTKMSNANDKTPFRELDDVIITLGTEIAIAIRSKGAATDWTRRAKELLLLTQSEVRDRPDRLYIAQPFSTKESKPIDDYWLNPFIKE